MRTTRRNAEVTLSGLRVVPKAPGEEPVVYSWQNVARLPANSPFWGVWDAEGNRVREGDGCLELLIKDARGSRLACRVQERALRNALRAGELQIVEGTPRPIPQQRITLLILCAVCLGLAAVYLGAPAELSARIRILGAAFWGGLALLPALAMRNWRRLRHIQLVRLDRSGMHLLVDNREILLSWLEVIPRSAHSCVPRVSLPGVGKVNLDACSSRVFRAVYAVAGELSPARRQSQLRARTLRLPRRGMAAIGVCFVVVAWGGTRLLLPSEPTRSYVVAVAGLVVWALLSAALQGLFWLGSPRRLRLKSRRRRMRAAIRV